MQTRKGLGDFFACKKLAWQAISQRAVNNVAGEILPAGARLHDDFGLEAEPDFTQPLNKDVYVENYSGQNPQNTSDQGERVFVRVKLMEYMEMGDGAGLFTLSGNDPSDYQTLDQVEANGTRGQDSANHATSLVTDASILDLGTWRTHVEGDTANPFVGYWNWTMGGTKAFMPTFNKDNTSLLTDRTAYAHNEFITGVDTESGTASYSNPTYDGNPEVHTAKDTLATAGVVSMDEWMNDLNHLIEEAVTENGYWVGDTDGWYYWSKALEPGEATALLLDQITLTGTIEGEFYYGIHVISQMATAGDWGDATDETGFYEDSLTEDGKFLLDQAAGPSTKKEKLLYAPMDDIGTTMQTEMLFYMPFDGVGFPNDKTPAPTAKFINSVDDSEFTAKGGTITHDNTSYIVGNQSAYFTGATGQRINSTTPNLDFGTNDFTISFWVNPAATTKSHSQVFSTDVTTQANGLRFFLKNAGNAIVLSVGGTDIIRISKAYNQNVWTHYAIVRKDGIFTIYEDGVSVGSTSSYKTTNINITDLSIGGSSNTGDREYIGYIDDFAVYSYAKYNTNFTRPGVNAMDDPDNVTSSDKLSIKNEIDGSNFGFLGSPKLIGQTEISKFDASVYFPGSNGQRIQTNNSNLNFGTKDFTISFWLNYAAQTKDNSLILSNAVNSKANGLRFFVRFLNQNAFTLISGDTEIFRKTDTVIQDTWNHFAIVRENGVFKLYVNGTKVAENTNLLTKNIDITDLSISGSDITGDREYKGYMDDFIIYDDAVWGSDFTPPTAAGTP